VYVHYRILFIKLVLIIKIIKKCKVVKKHENRGFLMKKRTTFIAPHLFKKRKNALTGNYP